MRNPLRNRIVFQVAVFMIVGIVLATNTAVFRRPLMFVGMAVLAVLCGCFIRKKRRIALWVFGLCAGAMLTTVHGARLTVRQIPRVAQVSGRIAALPRTNETRMSLELDDCAINGQPIHKKMRVYVEGVTAIEYNDRIEISETKLSVPKVRRNPGGNHARRSAWARNIAIQANAELKNIHVQAGEPHVFRVLYAWRARMEYALERTMTPEAYGAVKGMLFGDTSDMEEEWVTAFQRTGIMHVLAVSGQHVSILIGAMAIGIKRIKRRSIQVIVMSGFLFAYSVMSGFSVSVVRAVYMAIFVLIGDWLGEKNDTLTSLALSAIVLLVYNPFQLFHAGFLLSYSAVMGICIFYPPVDKQIEKWDAKHRFLPAILRILAMSYAAQLGVMPIQLALFGTLSTVSLIVNLLITPLVSIVVIVGFIAALLGSIWYGLAFPASWIAEGGVRMMALIVLGSASIPFASIEVGAPPWWGWIAFGLAAMGLWKWTEKASIRGICIGGALGVMAIGIPIQHVQTSKSMEIIFLDVGQGDAIYVRQGHTHILLDGGNRFEEYDNGAQVILPFLSHQGVRALDAVIVSHPDMDHIGGLKRVIEHVPTKQIITGPDTSDESGFMQVAEEKQIPHDVLMAEDQFSIGKAKASVLAPYQEQVKGNEASLVVQIDYVGFSALLMGDAEFLTEEQGEAHWVPVDVLKIGHHGSKNATSTRFLEKTQPKYAIVSAGQNNRYGHPNPDVLGRLEGQGVDVLRTDQQGAIMIDVDESGYRIRTCISG